MAILFSVFIQCSAAHAQDVPISGVPCTTRDLSGTFVLVSFNEDPPGKESRWRARFRYEYMTFANNTPLYNSRVMSKQLTTPAQVQEVMGKLTGYNKYTLSADGTLDLYSDHNVDYSNSCIVSPRNEGSFMKGDLILTHLTKGGGHKVYKLFRHWY